MKRTFYLLLFLGLCFNVAIAQQKPQYTQYVFNNILLNPAVTGIENYVDLKLGYRSQWTGLQGAPVTSYITVSAPIGQDFIQGDATSFSGLAGSPYSRSFVQDYRAAEPHHGIGFTLVTDQAGPITTTNLDINYAYHIGLTERLNLSLGVAGGFARTNLNTSLITLETALDPAISNGVNAQWSPDVNAGVWLYGANFFVGVSAQQILPQNLYFTTSRSTIDASKTVPHYFATAGARFFLSDDLSLVPSLLVKEIQPVPLTYDVNLKMMFQDKFWIGGSYRHADSFGALVGFNLSSFINVGYSYDITTSSLNTVSNGTHEIVIGLLLNNRAKVTCPQHGL